MPSTNLERVSIRSQYLAVTLLVLGCSAEEAASPPRIQQAPVAVPELSVEHTLQLRVSENPSDLQALVRLGDLYYDENRHAEAIPLYTQALALEPGRTGVRTDLGTCFVALKQYGRARAAYEQVMLEDPTHLKSVFNLGVVENLEGNHGGAAVLWERAASMTTDPAQASQFRQLAIEALQKEASKPPGK